MTEFQLVPLLRRPKPFLVDTPASSFAFCAERSPASNAARCTKQTPVVVRASLGHQQRRCAKRTLVNLGPTLASPCLCLGPSHSRSGTRSHCCGKPPQASVLQVQACSLVVYGHMKDGKNGITRALRFK